MKIHLADCPDRACQVRVVWSRVSPEDSEPALASSFDVICLDADESCSGPVCTLFSIATPQMKDRLRRFEDPRPWDRDWTG